MIKNIRVIQKKQKKSGFVEEHGKYVFREWVENVSWTLQIRREDPVNGEVGEYWEGVPVFEEWADE